MIACDSGEEGVTADHPYSTASAHTPSFQFAE